MKEYVITTQQAGQRLDKYLKKVLPNASTGFLYKMLRKKNIVLNKKKATGQETLKDRDVIAVFFSDETLAKFEQSDSILTNEFQSLAGLPDTKLDIVYEDKDLLVINKAAGMPIHPSLHNYDNSLGNALAWYFRQKNTPFVFRCINRLDRDTSGLTIVAKHMVSGAILGQQVAAKSMQGEQAEVRRSVPSSWFPTKYWQRDATTTIPVWQTH